MLIKRLKIFLGIFIPFFAFFLMSHNVFAVSVGTSSFDLHYKANSSSQFVWQNNMLYGSSNGVIVSSGGSINQYQFNTSAVEAGGSSASIHFETNIVSTWYFDYSYNPWVNLSQQNVIVCNSSPAGATTISRNLGTATTLWGNRQANTLTLYGDVTVSGLTAGTTYTFTCAIGSSDYSFYDINSTIGSSNVWFEQNPLTFSWFTDESQALMQTQINQNETIINLNQQIINSQNQNTQDIINNQNQNADDIIKSNQRCGIKNYFKLPDTQTKNTINFTKNSDGTFNMSGSSSSNTSFTIFVDGQLESGIYTLSRSSGNFNVAVQDYNGSSYLSQLITLNNAPSNTLSINPSGTRTAFVIQAKANVNYNLTNIKVQLEKGSTVSSFLPYNEEFCTNFTQEYNDKQYEAWDNIGGQSANDIDGATNQQTTNLIGTISSFVTALGSIITNGSCELTLPFPALIGGNQVVNPCNGADKAPAIITAASSLLLITVFVPLAFILVKMIYSEIRSFTNG